MTAVAKAGDVYIPVTVLGELYFGALRSADPQLTSKEIENFMATCVLLEPDEATARYYAVVKAALFKKGRPILENDIWIAAITMQHDLPIYTFDNDFKNVDGLQLFNPLSSI